MFGQVKSGVVLTFVSLFLGNIVSFLYTPFMLRILGQGEYGLFGLANSVAGYLTVLDFGFNSAIVRYTAKYRVENQEFKLRYMYGMFILLYVVVGVIIFFAGFAIANNSRVFFSSGLSEPEIITLRKLLVLTSINLAISFPLNVFTSIIIAYERFVFLKISSIVRYIINPMVYIPVLLLGFKSVGLTVATTILNCIFLLMNLAYCFIKINVKISFRKFDLTLLKEIASYSIWIFMGSIVNQLWWNSGQLMLGIYSSSASIATYNLAMQFKNYFETFATSISGVFLPHLTRMESSFSSNNEFTNYFIKVGRLQFMLISLIITGFILFGKQFILIWAGTEYNYTYYVTLIIFIPLALVDTQTLGIAILQAKNKHRFRSIVYLCVAILCVVLCIPLIKKYDVFGCATATALALIVGNIFIMNWYYHKKIGLNVFRFWKEIVRIIPSILVLSLVALFSLRFLPPLHTYKLLFPVVLSYIVLFVLVMYFLVMNSYEKELVKGIITNMKGVKK